MDDKIPHKRDQRPVMITSKSLKNHPVCWGAHCSTIAGPEFDYPGGTPAPIWLSNADFYPLHNLATTYSCRPALSPQHTHNSEFPWDHGPKHMCELMIIWGQKKHNSIISKENKYPQMKSKTSEWVMSKDEVSSYWNQHTASVNRRFVFSPILVNAQVFL